jgi:CRISPR-associated exonuclease Cas4
MSDPSLPYGKIAQVIHIKGRPFFPISWLQKQDYCEYQIWLENIRGIKVKPTQSMVEGTQQHEQLYDRFAQEAAPATVEQMLDESKKATIFSREFRVLDAAHGIYGYIDEVWLTPDSFVVIDDKPGTRAFTSNIHQIYGYCLAFKTIIEPDDKRGLIAALRERGTDNIIWQAPFNHVAEEEIVPVIGHIHNLISGKESFSSSANPNKCKVCRLKGYCNQAKE